MGFTTEMSIRVLKEGLERKFHMNISLSRCKTYMNNPILAQYRGLERKMTKGLEMSKKLTLFVITFEPLEVGS